MMVRLHGACIALVTACLPAQLLAADSSRTPTIDQSIEYQTVGSPKISPDGTRIVYEQTRTNWTTNAFDTDLWIVGPSGVPQRLTVSLKSNGGAEWSPDGRLIAFLSDRPGQLEKSPADKRQVYVIAPDGGEARQITRFENGVKTVHWGRDGRSLIVAAEGPTSKERKDRKESFGDIRVVHSDYSMTHLWRVTIPEYDAAGRLAPVADTEALTKGDDFSIQSFEVSPDGKSVAFSAQRDPDLISGRTAQIYVVDLADLKVSKIVDGPGPNNAPHWSPDGKKIAFTTPSNPDHSFYTNNRIAVVGRQGGNITILNPSFDENSNLVEWNEDGIYFSAQQKTEAHLFLLDPNGTKSHMVDLGMPTTQSVSLSRTARTKTVAFVGAGPNAYREIYKGAIGKGKPVAVTAMGSQFAAFNLARREVVSWTSEDGTTVEGILYKPANFESGRRYPLLVVIHGGPTGADTPDIAPDRYYPVERFVAKGALVLKPNYRGSAGYGEHFRALNVRNLGVGDYADVISGVDALIKKGLVDSTRVGSMGWSQGGYISAFITTSSDRFKAVSVGAGISDWMTYYANTDITPFTAQYLGATPWADPEIYRKTSPITYIDKARTPTLIQHGGADRRVPIPNAYELRQALEDKGVPVKMVVYEGFGHPIDKPKQQRAVMEENENWFGHYIWGDPLASSPTP